jgi:hypothetical protein
VCLTYHQTWWNVGSLQYPIVGSHILSISGVVVAPDTPCRKISCRRPLAVSHYTVAVSSSFSFASHHFYLKTQTQRSLFVDES